MVKAMMKDKVTHLEKSDIFLELQSVRSLEEMKDILSAKYDVVGNEARYGLYLEPTFRKFVQMNYSVQD